MNITERFLKYVTFDTRSDDASNSMPSSHGQLIFARYLEEELVKAGMEEVELDDNGYLMATLPPNSERTIPTIGFIAHLDTSPDMSGAGVKPKVIKYAGGDVILSEEENIILSPDTFPELKRYVGQDIIVTDGTTLLGADDKAGVAAIVSAMEYLIGHKEIEHGKIRIAFTPDEEIGRGADRFDVKRFGCKWAYTVDGGAIGELEYENFNAVSAEVRIKGRNIHPGYAKGKMINAALMATTFAACMPPEMRPDRTEGYEGFIHLTGITGTVEEATLSYILRDHDLEALREMAMLLQFTANAMNTQYPDSVRYTIKEQYLNMAPAFKSRMHIIDLASKAMREAGVEPVVKPIRGGTDGARLTYMGLPCPNIFTGGHNIHGRYEYLPVLSLEKSMQTVINIIKLL